MKCPNCGAEIIGDQTFCTSCGSNIIRENLYDVRIPTPTRNMKAITTAARILGKSKVKTAEKLSKANALIATGISLSEASKIKSLFKSIGLIVSIDSKTKINISKETGGAPKRQNSAQSSLPPAETAETERADAKKSALKQQPEKGDKQNRVLRGDKTGSSLKKAATIKRNNLSTLLASTSWLNGILVFAIVSLLLVIIFFLVEISNNQATNTEMTPADSASRAQREIAARRKASYQKLSNLFRDRSTGSKGEKEQGDKKGEKILQQKGKKVKHPTRELLPTFKKTVKKMKQADTGQQQKITSDLKDLLRSVSSPAQRDLLKEEIKKDLREPGRKIGKLPEENYQTGQIRQQGTRFMGSTPLPDKTQIIVKIKNPAGKTRVSSKTVRGGKFSLSPFTVLEKGEYEIKVELVPLARQIAGLRKILPELVGERAKKSAGNTLLFRKTITLAAPQDEEELYSKTEIKEIINDLLNSSFKGSSVNYENLLDQEADDLVIEGHAEDEASFILKACAGVGFTSLNSNEESGDLIIIVNEKKYQIPVAICAEAMEIVANDFSDLRFKEHILTFLQ